VSGGAGARTPLAARRRGMRAEAAPALARRSRWTWRTRLRVALLGWLIAAVLRVLYGTLRLRIVDPAGIATRGRSGERVLIAFWHDGIVLMPMLLRRLRWPGRVSVLLSWHRDAEIAARAVAHLGIDSVRGSSTRGWMGGLRALLEAHARGDHLVIVPDGPRGPRHRAKDGVVQLARATGRPVIAVGIAASPVRRLQSWDRLQLPLPFARVAVVAAEPIVVPRDADEGAMAAARAAVQEALAATTVAAGAAVGARAA